METKLKVFIVDLSRFELLTLRLSGVHSNQLSYRSEEEELKEIN